MKKVEEVDFDEIMETISKDNDPKYNLLKLAEELAELQEKVLKTVLKTPDKKPKKVDLAEEIGDVFLRMIGLISTDKELEDLVNARLSAKALKLKGYYESGKFKGGV